MKLTIRSKVFILLIICSEPVFAGKEHCKGYRDKLDNIYAQQRQANSHKRSNSLALRENKAREAWWRCENGERNKKPKQKKKSQQVKYEKITKVSNKSTIIDRKINKSKAGQVRPFTIIQPIIMRTKYQEKQLEAWLRFYQPEKKCSRPKSMKIFATCVEDKRRQQAAFEKSYLR
jgi:hypothetical protein